MIEAGINRNGPYVNHGKTYANLLSLDGVFTIDFPRAVEVLVAKATGKG